MMVWILAVIVLIALLAVIAGLRRRQRRQLFLPLARRIEAEYRELVTTRAPLVTLDAAHDAWQSQLPPALFPEPAPAWAATGAAAETYAAARQFERDSAQLAADLDAWLRQLAAAIARDFPQPGIHAAVIADYLYRRLNGLTTAEAGLAAGVPARLAAGPLVLAEGDAQTLETLAAHLPQKIRELLPLYLPYRERFTRLQVALDRLVYHLRALGAPPPPFGVKHHTAAGT